MPSPISFLKELSSPELSNAVETALRHAGIRFDPNQDLMSQMKSVQTQYNALSPEQKEKIRAEIQPLKDRVVAQAQSMITQLKSAPTEQAPSLSTNLRDIFENLSNPSQGIGQSLSR